MVGSFKSADINLSQINQWILTFMKSIDTFFGSHICRVCMCWCVYASVRIWVNVRQHASVHKLKHWTIYMQNIQHIRLGLDFFSLCIFFFLKYLIFWTERHSRGFSNFFIHFSGESRLWLVYKSTSRTNNLFHAPFNSITQLLKYLAS